MGRGKGEAQEQIAMPGDPEAGEGRAETGRLRAREIFAAIGGGNQGRRVVDNLLDGWHLIFVATPVRLVARARNVIRYQIVMSL